MSNKTLHQLATQFFFQLDSRPEDYLCVEDWILLEKLGEAIEQAEQAQPLRDYVAGCFDAAFAEGLAETLANTTDERLKDLVERRLMYAYHAAQSAPPPSQPLTDEQAKPVALDAEQWGDRLNDASWAAVEAWDSDLMGRMPGAVFNNLKGVVRAAILKYLDGYTALDQAIEQAEQVQPVAWINQRCIVRNGECVGHEPPEVAFKRYGDWSKSVPLYTAPAQRKPLTDGERFQAFARADKKMMINGHRIWRDVIADEIEAAHGITKENK